MDAATYRNIAGVIAQEFGNETAAEAVNLVADVLLGGGKDMGRNMVLDKVVPALFAADTLADDITALLKAYEDGT